MEGGRVAKSKHDYLIEFLRDMGCQKRGELYFLDGFDEEFYLVFDTTAIEEHPNDGTASIYITRVGEPPRCNDVDHFRIVANANHYGIMRMMAAIGIQRFSEQTKTAYYRINNPLRAK